MTSEQKYQTGIGTSTADSITLLGKDLASEILGKVSFGELAFWLIAKRKPTKGELIIFEAVLASLADHGFTPTAIAARLTYSSAPDSLQGALASGLLGGGSRFLGVTEDCAKFLNNHINSLKQIPTTVEVKDIYITSGSGALVGRLTSSSRMLDLQGYAPGQYYVWIVGSTERAVRSFIVSK